MTEMTGIEQWDENVQDHLARLRARRHAGDPLAEKRAVLYQISIEEADEDEDVCGDTYDHDLRVISEGDGSTTYECRRCYAEIIEDDADSGSLSEDEERERSEWPR